MSIDDERKKHLEEAQYASTVRCISCQSPFRQTKGFEQMCPVCFKLDRGYNLLLGDKALLFLQEEYQAQTKVLHATTRKLARGASPSAPASIRPERVKQLIRLCHPDKHGDSQVATEVTQWLLSMRSKHGEGGT